MIKIALTAKEACNVMFASYPDVVDVEQLSKMLGVSKKVGYKLVQNDIIHSFRIGRQYRIPKLFVMNYLQVTKLG